MNSFPYRSCRANAAFADAIEKRANKTLYSYIVCAQDRPSLNVQQWLRGMIRFAHWLSEQNLLDRATDARALA